MVVALALALSALFGAGDQYLGSLSAHPWAAQVSLLSAPWLVLPFLAGCTQHRPRRAALLGLGCTFSALIGYCVMLLSPVENAHISLAGVEAFVRSDPPVFIGGLVTGPLFGWLGQRWSERRSWWAALATAGAVCLEPLARVPVGDAIRASTVWVTEVGVGVAMAVYFAHTSRASRRAADPTQVGAR